MARVLEGVRVLVVEDDFLVALLFEDVLASAGCTVLGPVPRLAAAVAAAAQELCDVAVLDINLAGDWVYPVAAVLAERNVPFLFVTGYCAIPPEYAGRPCIAKPFTGEQLSRALVNLVKPATVRSPQPSLR
jgi:two-component SAPR family response regulator